MKSYVETGKALRFHKFPEVTIHEWKSDNKSYYTIRSNDGTNESKLYRLFPMLNGFGKFINTRLVIHRIKKFMKKEGK